MKNIVIFGGTFDPIHVGHLKIYLAIKKQFKFDKFLIVPTKNTPLKNHQPYACCQDRVAMIKLMFNKYKDVRIENYEINKNGDGISYTIDTVKYLQNKYPGSKLYLIVGLDRFDDFKKWKAWKEILKIVTLIIIPRHKQTNDLQNNGVVIKMPLINISSSQLRSNPDIKFLTPSITKYIAEHGLYIDQQIKHLLSNERYKHTLRVTMLALEFANIIDKKLLHKTYIASMYHDVCKEFDDEQTKLYAKQTHKYPHMLHGIAGANYIKKHFHITDKKIINAISYHVLPNRNPSMLTKILYCADKLEPKRTKQDIKDRLGMIKLIKKDINKYFWQLVKLTQAKYKD